MITSQHMPKELGVEEEGAKKGLKSASIKSTLNQCIFFWFPWSFGGSPVHGGCFYDF